MEGRLSNPTSVMFLMNIQAVNKQVFAPTQGFRSAAEYELEFCMLAKSGWNEPAFYQGLRKETLTELAW